jgi:hypothetical protein
MAESLAAAEPRNLDYQKRVSNNLAYLADAQEGSGDLQQALGDRERQLRLLADVARIDPRDTKLQQHAMTAHRSVGRLLASQGDTAGGLKELLAGVAISDDLFRIEPDNTDWLQANAIGRFDLADLQLGAGQTAAAAATARSMCDITDRLVNRDKTVADWKSMLRARCLELRARVALAGNDASQASFLARQWLSAAASSPVAIDRSLLGMRAFLIGGDALAASGQREEAKKWWSLGLRSVLKSIELRPSDQAIVAALKLRLGDRAGAQQLISSLAAMGYRHPAYIAAIRSAGGRA